VWLGRAATVDGGRYGKSWHRIQVDRRLHRGQTGRICRRSAARVPCPARSASAAGCFNGADPANAVHALRRAGRGPCRRQFALTPPARS
jgi:hypothetical protein